MRQNGWIRWHWQNLNDNDGRRPAGRPWHGRAWAQIARRDERGPQVRVDWALGRFARSCDLNLEWGGGDSGSDVTLHLSLHRLASLWLTLEYILPRRWQPAGIGSRRLGISYADHRLGVELWHEWKGYGPQRAWSLSLPDLLFGREKRSERATGSVDTAVALPEGVYPARIEFHELTARRPRWHGARLHHYATIDLLRPIPVPGKGDNDWDQDDNAIYSMSCQAESVEEAIAHLVKSVARDRREHGGLDWLPGREEARNA
jgi:hypothetical protein